MKLDIFNHIFPRAFYERMLKVAPNGKDMHKRVREIPCIVDLDERFRIMDRFGDYAQVICLAVAADRGVRAAAACRPSWRDSPTTAWPSWCASTRSASRPSSPRCR